MTLRDYLRIPRGLGGAGSPWGDTRWGARARAHARAHPPRGRL